MMIQIVPDFLMEAFSPPKACRSCCKADIRNPLPHRLVLCALEARECLFYLQITTILHEKTVSFFSYFMTFFALLQDRSGLLMPYASPSPASLWKGSSGCSEGTALKRSPRRSDQLQALRNTRPSRRKNAAGSKPSGSAGTLF